MNKKRKKISCDHFILILIDNGVHNKSKIMALRSVKQVFSLHMIDLINHILVFVLIIEFIHCDAAYSYISNTHYSIIHFIAMMIKQFEY